ncbi:hypothetical protein GCM10011506_10410 [Marivirga lumbricoides]|uniref:NRDE family protein n=1 Tax=Marivirga lumbricoides TaxID=1046115 RepID=A0ABQ1LM69_9BACT|nr:hypothetical protein GCM10011506_10410 [Marivirga lumbricoides]
MCTLTYLPLENQQFIITTNRDESPDRGLVTFPVYRHIEGKNIIFPQDPKGGGSWVATSDNGISACLLNGAFEPHVPQPEYKISRGIILLEAIECIKPDEFFKNYNFEGVEPFTIVVFFHDPELTLLEFRWDGINKHLKEFDASKPHIWASAQLYTKQAIKNRQKWFGEWLSKNHNFSVKEIREFHKNAGSGDLSNDMIMDRGIVKTVSISHIYSKVGLIEIGHENILTHKYQELSLSQHVNQQFSHQVL